MSTNKDALNNLKRFASGTRVRWQFSRRPVRVDSGTIEGSALMQTGRPSGPKTLELVVRVRWDAGDSELQYAKYLEVVPS